MRRSAARVCARERCFSRLSRCCSHSRTLPASGTSCRAGLPSCALCKALQDLSRLTPALPCNLASGRGGGTLQEQDHSLLQCS